MRLTKHSKRISNAKHNDRQFNLQNASHIDSNRTQFNHYWNIYEDSNMTIDEVERKFYEDNFTEEVNRINNNYIKNRHQEKCKSIDNYRGSKYTCVEEEIIQLGSIKDGSIDGVTLWNLYAEQARWEMEKYKNVKILDISLHMDEATPHLHVRKCWVAHKDNRLIVSQTQALSEMGVIRPNLSQKESRYNNAKMAYTKDCREHFTALCKEKGLDIIEEPREASKSGLSQLEFKRQQEEKKINDIEQRELLVNERSEYLNDRINAYEKKKKNLDKIINQRAEAVGEEIRQVGLKEIEKVQRKYNDIIAEYQNKLEKLPEDIKEYHVLKEKQRQKKKDYDEFER